MGLLLNKLEPVAVEKLHQKLVLFKELKHLSIKF